MPRFPRLDLLFGVPVEGWRERQLEQAVTEAVREDADLDWKQQPYAAYKGVSEEVGKDVAALANAGGGVLVFGVRETSGRAADLVPFPAELAAAAESRILGSVGEKVAPVPVGLGFRWIDSARGGGYLVAMVPRSPDVPHAVRLDRGKLGYPTRDADQTRWMSEAEVASRYRDRFSLRQSRSNRVDDVHAAALGAIMRSNRLLLAMTLVPEIPGRALVGKQGVDDVRAWTDERPWFPSMLSLDYDAVRVGLRKVLASSALNELAEADYGHVEWHEDGSGAVVVDLSGGGLVLGQPAIRGAPVNQASALVRWVEAAVISGLDLLTRHASQRARCSGDASVRLEMLAGAGWVMTLSEPTPISGEDRRAPGARLLRGDPPRLESTVDLDAVSTSPVGLLTTARLLAVDLLSVFGVGPDSLAVSVDGNITAARFGREAREVTAWLERVSQTPPWPPPCYGDSASGRQALPDAPKCSESP